jgi:predicted nucleic acid-binding protein
MGLLEDLVGARGEWCAAVAQEVADWTGSPGFEDVAEAQRIFGAPLFPSAAEHVEIRAVQGSMLAPGDGARQHLGEAETIVVARARFGSALFVTDDAGAKQAALAAGLHPVGTGDLLDLAVKTSRLEQSVSDGCCDTLRAASRFVARWLP